MHNKEILPNLDISPIVQKALKAGKPIVALESTIICHGMPYPQNIQTAEAVENIVVENGAIPATIAIIQGCLKVGLSSDEMNYLAKNGQNIPKISRRDLPFSLSQKSDGATTVAATMIIAAMANIKVFATGGIGGVHRDINDSLDISADLQELANTNVAVVCSGVKSILDIPRTLEYLETHGVPIIGYQTDKMPAFYTSESGSLVDYNCQSTDEIAKAMKIKWEMHFQGGIVVANPIPKKYSLPLNEINSVIKLALSEMKEKNIIGKKTTPFLLSKIAEKTKGKSLESNIQLVLNNASLAAQIARSFTELS
ncbi:MAG: pseudouridine-5'-phosphate glycosidase [Woeseiaceae bacterium]|nr:pseudouridine-5'-phosphate glycosidase [Woeseiaceae bacterium]